MYVVQVDEAELAACVSEWMESDTKTLWITDQPGPRLLVNTFMSGFSCEMHSLDMWSGDLVRGKDVSVVVLRISKKDSFSRLAHVVMNAGHNHVNVVICSSLPLPPNWKVQLRGMR